MWVDRIATVFLVKEHGPRNYYLGNDYTYHDGQDTWIYGIQTYAKEAVACVERLHSCLSKESTHMPVTDCHLELDTSPLLNLDDHRKYHMLLGMLQCMLTIGKPKISQLVSFLNRFDACPREGHLDLAVRSFGYTKTTMHTQIAIDSLPMEFNRSEPNFKKLIPDFRQDYPDAKEEMHPGFPSPFEPVLQPIILWTLTMYMIS